MDRKPLVTALVDTDLVAEFNRTSKVSLKGKLGAEICKEILGMEQFSLGEEICKEILGMEQFS